MVVATLIEHTNVRAIALVEQVDVITTRINSGKGHAVELA
jgi:hypothetical protein